jgi:hypothetical protein
VERLAADGPRLRSMVRDLAECVGAAVAGLVVFTILVAIFSGSPDWSPYVDYIRLYEKGFGALPVIFFSSGPLMGALTILSAAGLGWVALERRVDVPAPARVALAGFTGFAMSTYTYYLGRSAPTNLPHILPPVAAYLTVWVSVFLRAPRNVPANASLAAAAALIFAGSATAVNSWPLVKDKWDDTALAQVVPFADGGAPGSGRSFRQSLRTLWHLPVMDPRAENARRIIDRHWKPGEPVLALMGSDLTTETLMRAGRRNLLPISHPLEDDLIDSSDGRVLDAAAEVRPGTLMLLNDPATGAPPPGFEDPFTGLQQNALTALQTRFRFHTVEHRGGVKLVRLDPRS